MAVNLRVPAISGTLSQKSTPRIHEFHYRWEWILQSSPAALWPYITDTNRFNRDTGLPPVQADAERTPTENARRHFKFSRLGITVAWEESPFEWVYPHRFGVVRRYSRGPVTEMRVRTELIARPEGGTRVVYEVWASASTLLGRAAIHGQIGLLAARTFRATVFRYDRLAATGAVPNAPGAASFVPGGRTRLAKLHQVLLTEGVDVTLAGRLVETIEQADDLSLARIRPYALADQWNAPRSDVLRTCLLATRLGLLDLQWELLCPRCRVTKQRTPSLAGVVPTVHCETCGIDFTINFDRSVEVTFRPNPTIRRVVAHDFCLGGPQVTPHVVAQQIVPAGARRELHLPLTPGRYQLRTITMRGLLAVRSIPDGPPFATIRAAATGWPEEEVLLGSEPTLVLENADDREHVFILEQVAWSDQAATAAEVTALQLFRDLFAHEALRPGERIEVGTLTILFTDLCSSTQLYRKIGDAPAFGLVMSHFDLLRDAIAAEHGGIVKTIGDAVMAVFPRPVSALRALQRIREQQEMLADGQSPLLLKAGVHTGPCIAVTLNDRLDYFGSSINLAARLPSLAAGGEIIMSSAVRDDPEVDAYLTQLGALYVSHPFEARLKGFDHVEQLCGLTPAPAVGSPAVGPIEALPTPLAFPRLHDVGPLSRLGGGSRPAPERYLDLIG